MKILLLSRYSSLGASSRFRLYQYLPYLQKQGCEITIQPLLGDNYIHHLYDKTAFPATQLLKSYFKRILYLLNKHQFDLIWLQQEAFPWIPAWFEQLLLSSEIPIVVDHDDAFFHRYDMHSNELIRFVLGRKIDKIMTVSDVVVAGNDYLADRAKENGCKKISIIPTVVDTEIYVPTQHSPERKFTIGWLGSPHTAKYLLTIGDALSEIVNEGEAELKIVGSKNFSLPNISANMVDWSQESEVAEIQSFDVGIMPLLDSPWERGKCGFKLIQYLACGIPVIASPVGVNAKIVKHGENGFLANSNQDWIEYLRILKQDSSLRKNFGARGRKLVEENYSLHVTAPKLFEIFKNISK